MQVGQQHYQTVVGSANDFCVEGFVLMRKPTSPLGKKNFVEGTGNRTPYSKTIIFAVQAVGDQAI